MRKHSIVSLAIDYYQHVLAINFNGLFLDFSALCSCRLLALHKPFKRAQRCVKESRVGQRSERLKKILSLRVIGAKQDEAIIIVNDEDLAINGPLWKFIVSSNVKIDRWPAR